MADVWQFPDPDALWALMSSGVLPVEVLQGPIRYRFADEDKSIHILPKKSLPRGLSKDLLEAGVVKGKESGAFLEARFWAQALPPQPANNDDEATPLVLFVCAPGPDLLRLLGELVRLGCHQCGFRIEGRYALVRAANPPFYTVCNTEAAYRVFVPAVSGREDLWIERGYQHRAAASLRIDEGIEVIKREGEFLAFSGASFTEVAEVFALEVPSSEHEAVDAEAIGRLPISIHFGKSSRADSASFWVLDKDPEEEIEALLRSVPDSVADELLFAKITDEAGKPVVILRARPGQRSAGVGALEGGFCQVPGVSHLHIPLGTGLEPPLRPATLQTHLAPDRERVYWLIEGSTGVHAHSLAEDDFAPLREWADYVIESNEEHVSAWVRSTSFQFQSYRSIGGEWSEVEKKDKEKKKLKPKRVSVRDEEDEEDDFEIEDDRPLAVPGLAREVAEAGPAPILQRKPDELELALAEIESQFLAMENPAGDPARTPLWISMGQCHAGLGQRLDTSLCWTRALWEYEGADLTALATQWRACEEQFAAALGTQVSSPSLPLLVAELLSGVDVADARASKLEETLRNEAQDSDVRSLWLGHLALSNRAGGDPLQMARARDAILERIRTGLSLDRDVPRFVRFAGSGPGDSEAANQLGDALASLWKHIVETKRKASAVEAPQEKTQALVARLFAVGFARLGNLPQCEAMLAEAGAAEEDDVSQYIAAACAARAEQAKAGRPATTAMPAEVTERLEALSKLDRYKVDRLRGVSSILEPVERLDPMRGFQESGDARGPEFAPLRGELDPGAILEKLRPILDKAGDKGTDSEHRARILDGAMDFFPSLSPGVAKSSLEEVLSLIPQTPERAQVLLLEEAMGIASLFDWDSLIADIAGVLGQRIEALGGEDALALSAELANCLGAMRRVGLAEEGKVLLAKLAGQAQGDTAAHWSARLHLARAQADLGDLLPAQATVKAGLTAIGKKKLSVKERLELSRALSTALSRMPQAEAVAGILSVAGQLKHMTDSFNTNSHFCLTVVAFVDAMVSALASSDLSMGEAGRKWLDEDEFLVRRRIHRDMGRLR